MSGAHKTIVLGTERPDTAEKEEQCLSTIGVRTESLDDGSDASLPRTDSNRRPLSQSRKWEALLSGDGNCEISSTRATREIPPCQVVAEATLATFVQLARERRPQLLWLAQRMTHNRDAAEDIVQDALLKAFKGLPRFRGESHMGTWLGAIVMNTGREWLRNQKGQKWISLGYARNPDDVAIVIDLPDPSRNPEKCCIQNEIDNILHSEIDRLNSVSKSTIRMCIIEERSHQKTAKMLGVSVGAIKSRIFHGKRMLRRAVCMRTGEGKELLRSFEGVP